MIQRARPPVVTLILIVANLIAAFGLLGYPDLVSSLGFRPDAPSFRTALTCLFLHENVIHLLGNMIFLAAVGAGVEIASGSIRFASVYFISGLVGVGAHYLMTRHRIDPAPFIGASGCIAGCAGYYSFRYSGRKVPVWPGREVSIALVTGVWVVLQVVGAFVRLGDTSGTSFWAHLAGFATGILLSLVFRAPDFGQAEIGHELIAKMTGRGPAAVVVAAQRHLKIHPNDPKALQELAKAYLELDDKKRYVETLLLLLDATPESEQAEICVMVLDSSAAERISPIRRTMLSEHFKESHPEVSRRLLESVIAGPESSQRPEALLALASLVRGEDVELSDSLLVELSDSYPLHPAMDVARTRGWVS